MYVDFSVGRCGPHSFSQANNMGLGGGIIIHAGVYLTFPPAWKSMAKAHLGWWAKGPSRGTRDIS